MTRISTSTGRYCLMLFAAALAMALAGCGDDEKPKSKEKKGVLGKDPNIRTQLGQVSRSLKNLESQLEEQQRRVNNAQKEVEALRKSLESYNPSDLAAVDWSTTLTVTSAKAAKKAKAEKLEREQATDGTFQTIVLLAFGALVIIFLGKLWLDRGNRPPPPSLGSAEVNAPASSTEAAAPEAGAGDAAKEPDAPSGGPPYSM